MKNYVANLVFVFVLLGLGISQNVKAVVTSQQAEELFSAAEQAFPQYFSPPLQTLTFPPDWQFYRGPYNNGIYVGINVDDSVYVVGGPFGDIPQNVGTYQQALAQVSSTNGSICSTNNIPDGLNYSQNGNVVTVTTDGCIPLPVNENICENEVSSTPQATGVSVLSETTVISSEFGGITATDPSVLDLLNNGVGASSFCSINAPGGFAPSTVNIDICFDVTDSVSLFSSFPGVTITPPVTSSINSTQINSVVADCFSTGALTITDNVSGNVWVNQNGTYIMVPDI